jgi:hypothetical protein
MTYIPARHHLDKRASAVAADARDRDPDELLTTAATAEWLGLSSQWLEIGRHRGYGPHYIRLSPRRIRYRRADVLVWLKLRSHQAVAEYR